MNKSPWNSTSTSHLGTRQVPLTSVLDKYLSPRYSTSTSHLGTRQVPLTSVLDKYLSPRYSTSTSHLGTRQVPLTSVLDKYLSPLIRFESCVDQGIVTHLSSLDLTRPSGRGGWLYNFKTSDINKARYKAFTRMSGGNDKEPLSRIKTINCASLPHAPRCLSITS